MKGVLLSYAEGDQNRFADRTGLNRTTISLMLGGKRAISDKATVRICNKLHIPAPEWIQPIEKAVAPVQATEGTGRPVWDGLVAETSRLIQSNAELIAMVRELQAENMALRRKLEGVA